MPETLREGTKKYLWKSNIDVKGLQSNTNNVNHLINKRLGKQPNRTVLDFELNLRMYKYLSKGEGKKLRWNNIPKKERNEIPKFLPLLRKIESGNRNVMEVIKSASFVPETTFMPAYKALPKLNDTQSYKHTSSVEHLF